MAKMYSKNNLKFEDGYVLNYDNEVVALPPKVAEQFNKLETIIQQQAYLAAQDKAKPEPSLDGFERESIVKHPKITVQTLNLDAEEKRCKGILDDIRKASMATEVNKLLDKFDKLMQFLHSDKFVEGTEVVMIDTPTIGNPLTADADSIIAKIGTMAGIIDSE